MRACRVLVVSRAEISVSRDEITFRFCFAFFSPLSEREPRSSAHSWNKAGGTPGGYRFNAEDGKHHARSL